MVGRLGIYSTCVHCVEVRGRNQMCEVKLGCLVHGISSEVQICFGNHDPR